MVTPPENSHYNGAEKNDDEMIDYTQCWKEEEAALSKKKSCWISTNQNTIRQAERKEQNLAVIEKAGVEQLQVFPG